MEEGDVQDRNRYCYATLTRHPYNPLKILGEFNSEEVMPWVRSRERVVWVSSSIPLIISYNEELSRSAFHILLANAADVNKEYQFAYIPTQTYSLKSITDFPHYEVLAQTIFEESNQGDCITSVILNKSVKRGHFILYAGTAAREIKVYEIDLYGSHNATKLLTKIANVNSMVETTLYTNNSFYLEAYRNHDGQLLN